jgi:hypothetical protein
MFMAKRLKRGRPPKKAAEKHTAVLNLKLTPQDRQTLVAGAKAANLPLRVWARSALLKAAKRLL